MKERLFIRISSDDKSLQWGILANPDDGEAKFINNGDLLIEDIEALGELVEAPQVIVMLPAHRVKCFNVKTPTKNRKHLEKAIPYQLEEQILDNVDSQHFALGSFGDDDQLQVNVVDKEYLSKILELLKTVEIEPDYVVSEASCLPYFKDAWSALVDDQVLVRQEPNLFWSAEQSLVKQLLQLELQDDELNVTQAMRVYSKGEQTLELDSIAGLATQKTEIEDSFSFLISHFDGKGINLLQQDFASQKKTQRSYGVWKLPAIAASLLLFFGLLYLVSYILYKNTQISNLEEQLHAETKKLYPSLPLTTAIVQINNSYRNIGGNEGSGVSFAGLMEKSMQVMDTQNIKFSQMEYIASRGQLNLDVSAENYDVLTRSQRNLESAGLKVEMRNASENGGLWTARITVGLNK